MYVVEQHGTTDGESCPAVVTPLSTTIPREAGSYQLNVSTAGGCSWNATSLSPFIEITGGASGSGAGKVTYFVSDNPSAESRTATLDVGSRTVLITQNGTADVPCSYTISTSEPLPPGGVTASIAVTAPAGCAWTANSDSDFLSITDGVSGSGSGTITVSSSANAEHAARLGELTIGGQAVGIMQLGAGGEPTCVTSVNPAVLSSPAIGVAGIVTVTAPSDCAWSAVSGAGWLTLAGQGSQRFGSGTFSYDIAIDTGLPRAATLHIGGQEVAITQDGATPTGNDSSELVWPAPQPKKANDCFGNCGGGCGTFLAVCGTNGGNWTSEVIGALQRIDDALQDVCVGDRRLIGVFPRYGATVRWTYHGVESPSCIAHDDLCRSWIGRRPVLGTIFCGIAIAGPYTYTICESARPWTWSYQEPAIGRARFPVSIVDNPDALPCDL